MKEGNYEGIQKCLKDLLEPLDRVVCNLKYDMEEKNYWWRNGFTYETYKCEACYRHNLEM